MAGLGIISHLRKDASWLVHEERHGNIFISKDFNKRPITIKLEKRSNNLYHLVFPSYIYQSAISHYTSSENESRFCRNKTLLFQLIRYLKHTGAWNFIDNINFLKVNTLNKNVEEKELQLALKGIL